MPLSIAICTHNRSRATRRCLAALGTLPPGVETLVVDSGSTQIEADAIRHAAADHGARHIRLSAPGLSEARNAALAASRGHWIAYLDDDAIPAPDWCAILLETIAAAPDLAATGGCILPRWQSRLPDWWPPSLRAVLTIIDQVRADDPATAGIEPYAANIAFRRNILTRFGGFPTYLGRRGTSMLSNEETYLIRRLRKHGLKVRFTPELVVHHEIDSTRLDPAWLLRRQYWSGVSEAMMLAALDEPRLVRTARLALHAIVLAPLGLWPRRSTRHVELRCKAAFARGFLHGALGEAASGHPAPP